MGNVVPTCCDEVDDQKLRALEKKQKRTKLSRQFTTTQFSEIVNYNKVYVLITDLSGLTRLTREYGTIHSVSIIMRQRQILYPIINKLFNPLTIQYEADNLIILFDNPLHALLCGLLIIDTVRKHNKSLPKNCKHFEILVDGVGIDVIDGIHNKMVQDKQTKVLYNISTTNDYDDHGDSPWHNAHLLAEDVADNGEYLLSKQFYNEIKGLQIIKSQQSLTFKARNYNDVGDVIQINGKYSKFVEYCNNEKAVNFLDVYPPKICKLSDKGYSADWRIQKIVQRYNFDQHTNDYDQYVKDIDSELNKKFIVKNCASLMFNVSATFKDGDDEQKRNPNEEQTKFFSKEKILLKFLKDIYDEFVGDIGDEVYEIGKSWLIFRSKSATLNCFQCALKLQGKLKEFNNNNNNKIKIKMSGIGCDYGDILMIRNTDICFGDAINTASKMGEDIAENDGEIIISDRFYQQIKLPQLANVYENCSFKQRSFNASNVTIKAYVVYQNK